MDFHATRVSTEDFAGDQIKSIILDANKQIEIEKKLISQGKMIAFVKQFKLDRLFSKLCLLIKAKTHASKTMTRKDQKCVQYSRIF